MTESEDVSAEEWLRNEDSSCYEDRLSHLEWLEEKLPRSEYWTFPGGMLAFSLFEEMRYSFVYAQYVATILLGLAYIERTLAALFYEAGRNDLKSAGLFKLSKEAEVLGIINRAQFKHINEARRMRNTYAHFRKPGHKDGVERRALLQDGIPYDVIKHDATAVMEVAIGMLERNAI